MNVARLLTEAAAARPDHRALVFDRRSYTYDDLDRETSRFADALGSLGLSEGGVVAIYLESCPELVIAYLGALKVGAVPNVVNGFLRPEEVRHVVADSGAKVVVTDPGRRDALAPERAGLGVEHVVVTRGYADEAEAGGDLAFDALIADRAERFDPIDLAPGTLANLLYTSGTTGNPKGVMLSHRNIVDNARQFAGVHYAPDEKLLVAAPLFHCWGLINGVLGVFAAGATALVERRFRTDPVLDRIDRERPTAMMGVPTMINYMARSMSNVRRDVSSLRYILCAAAPMPHELIETVRRDWKVGYAESYGLTETSPVITTTHHTEMRPGSCGRAMGDTRLKVVDAHGVERPTGEVGELWAWGTAISGGYYHRPRETAAVFTPDGWFCTGDIARIDADGYVTIVDRLKDMVNVAGEKVYPRDVEEVLHRHPSVADAVVIGVPDPDRGEVVKAFVVKKPGTACTAQELIEFLEPTLASYKVPRVIEFIEEVPRSPSGKALRRLLREA
jgi:long-chain acyl-CoA synthetase